MWELTIKRRNDYCGYDKIMCEADKLDELILVMETFVKHCKGDYEYNIVKVENEVE